MKLGKRKKNEVVSQKGKGNTFIIGRGHMVRKPLEVPEGTHFTTNIDLVHVAGNRGHCQLGAGPGTEHSTV